MHYAVVCNYNFKNLHNSFRDKLSVSNLTETRQKSSILFGNLDEIHAFHATVFYPELERCGANPASVGRNFLAHCSDFRALYSSYCQNMPSARQAITDLGGEANPASILHHCQTEAGHQLPLSSYLLKPMQRLTKYQLLLKDLVEVYKSLLAFFLLKEVHIHITTFFCSFYSGFKHSLW